MIHTSTTLIAIMAVVIAILVGYIFFGGAFSGGITQQASSRVTSDLQATEKSVEISQGVDNIETLLDDIDSNLG